MNDIKSTACIQFIRGIAESSKPEIRLTRNKDGLGGEALFLFNKPDTLSKGRGFKLNGMLMIDKEGELTTRNVSANLKNGQINTVEARYTWKSYVEFHRFMRFVTNYADSMKLNSSKIKEED